MLAQEVPLRHDFGGTVLRVDHLLWKTFCTLTLNATLLRNCFRSYCVSSPFGLPRLHCRTCVCNAIFRQRLCSLLFHFEAGSFMRYFIPQLDAHVRSGCYSFELHAMRLDISIATALTFRLSCFAKLIFVFLLGTAKPEAACVSAHSS